MLSIQPEKPGAGVWSWGFSGRVPLETLLAPPSVGRGAREGGGGGDVVLLSQTLPLRIALAPSRQIRNGRERRKKKKEEGIEIPSWELEAAFFPTSSPNKIESVCARPPSPTTEVRLR